MIVVCSKCHTIHEFDETLMQLKECHECGNEIIITEEDAEKEKEYVEKVKDK